MKFLVETGNIQENVPHRPAKLYSFDVDQYNLLRTRGFNFEV
jgi:hypothetical protein